MSVQGDGAPPDRGSFDKATVDRWQVFGGMAGVAGLLLSVFGGIKDQVPLSLIAAGVVTLVGVWLLYRWGRRPDQQLTKHFVVPVLLTVVGAVTGGVLVGLELRPTGGSAQPGATTTTTTTTTTSEPAIGDTTTHAASAPTTTTAATPAGTTPGVYRSSRAVTLNSDYYVDLDSKGDNGGVTDTSSWDTDLHFRTGLEADEIVAVGTAGVPPSHQECLAATALTGSVDSGKLKPGATFCLKTTEKRWAGLVVVSVERAESLVFDVVVWEKQA